MPEFHLNRPNPDHAFYTLDDFAGGYVEAMFFTNGDTGDEDEHILNRMGVCRLTKASVETIRKHCAAFAEANRADLDAAKELEPGSEGLRYGKDELDDRRLGQLFWYARQGHGVAFTDDGDAPCLERLQEAARKTGESYVEIARGWIYVR